MSVVLPRLNPKEQPTRAASRKSYYLDAPLTRWSFLEGSFTIRTNKRLCNVKYFLLRNNVRRRLKVLKTISSCCWQVEGDARTISGMKRNALPQGAVVYAQAVNLAHRMENHLQVTAERSRTAAVEINRRCLHRGDGSARSHDDRRAFGASAGLCLGLLLPRCLPVSTSYSCGQLPLIPSSKNYTDFVRESAERNTRQNSTKMRNQLC